MDRLIAEKETKKAQTEQVENVSQVAQEETVQEIVSVAPPTNEYVSSFEGQTIADIKREEEKKSAKEFEKEKEVLIEKQFEKVEETKTAEQQKVEEKESEKPVNIIEKPNYDLIEQPKKVLKIKKAKPERAQRKKSKLAGILLACTLGASAIVCIVNCNLIENMNSNLYQIEEGYQLRLGKYMRDIANLDGTKKSMEFLDTYPDKQLSAADQGEKSNWFDRLCNFIAGLFGG